MKKNVITLVGLLVVTIAVVGAWWLLSKDTGELEISDGAVQNSISSQSQLAYVIGSANTVPTKLEIVNQQDSYEVIWVDTSLEPTEDNLQITGLEGQPTNGLASLMTTAAGLPEVQTVETITPDLDLSLYGLSPPKAKVIVSYFDGTSATLLVGNDSIGNPGTYAMEENSDTIYLVDTQAVSLFSLSRYQLLSNQITTGGVGGSVLVKAELSGTVRDTPIVIEQLSNPESVDSSYSLYQITSPELENPVISTYGLALLQSSWNLQGTGVVGLVEEEGDLEQYGLSEPYSILKVTSFEDVTQTTPNNFELIVSAPDANYNVLVKRSDSPLVWQTSVDDLPWLSSTIVNLQQE